MNGSNPTPTAKNPDSGEPDATEGSVEGLNAQTLREQLLRQGGPSQTLASLTLRQHSGPLPSPEILAAYGHVDPTLPGRIMAMAERGHEALIAREQEKVRNYLATETVSRLFALIFAFLTLLLAGYVAHLGYPNPAVGMVIALLGSAIYTIISGKEGRRGRDDAGEGS